MCTIDMGLGNFLCICLSEMIKLEMGTLFNQQCSNLTHGYTLIRGRKPGNNYSKGSI